jgi:uncharacterized membrane protein
MNALAHGVANLLTGAWFVGAALMVLTIPACAYKIFAALWEADSPQEEQALYDKPGNS